MTTNATIDTTHRYIMALYYAYGVKDTAFKLSEYMMGGYTEKVEKIRRMDPMAFAEHHAAEYADMMAGNISSILSIQDSWRVWVGAQS